MEEVEASGPKQRGRRLKEVGYIPSPNTSGYWGLEASKYNPLLLHSSLFPGIWDGGGHRGFCYGCASWGNMMPIV